MNRLIRLAKSSIGAKAVMALTGVALLGFVVVHLTGKLLIFSGPDTLNAYAASLHSMGNLLHLARAGLLAAVVLHIASAYRLTLLNRSARPGEYRQTAPKVSSYATRTMAWSGTIVLAFILFHLAHFTFGAVQPEAYAWADQTSPNVYKMVVVGFSSVPIAASYIVAIARLGMHLSHGVTSMFQSLGVRHPRYDTLIAKVGPTFAILYALANISMPVAVLAGWIA